MSNNCVFCIRPKTRGLHPLPQKPKKPITIHRAESLHPTLLLRAWQSTKLKRRTVKAHFECSTMLVVPIDPRFKLPSWKNQGNSNRKFFFCLKMQDLHWTTHYLVSVNDDDQLIILNMANIHTWNRKIVGTKKRTHVLLLSFDKEKNI